MLKRTSGPKVSARRSEMSRRVGRRRTGVVYFAGHGMEVNGKNFLIPVDARLAKAGDLGLEAIALDPVMEQLAGATGSSW